MTRRTVAGAVLVGMVRVIVATGAMAQEVSARPAVALTDVAILPAGWTVPPPRLSDTIVELMTNELVASDRFRLYDGQWLVPDPETVGRPTLEQLRAAAVERHVDYLVVGSLTGFSTENKKKTFGGVIPTPFLLGGVTKQRTQLRVELTFRIVDVRTGEVVATATGNGIGARGATGVTAGGVIGRSMPLPVGALAQAKLPAARDAMLEEALRQAAHNAAAALAASNFRLRAEATEHQSK